MEDQPVPVQQAQMMTVPGLAAQALAAAADVIVTVNTQAEITSCNRTAHVVKTMNTAAMTLMANPASIAASSVFLSGENADAKAQTAGLLTDLGWTSGDIVDLGGIDTAGGPEHYFFMFFRLAGALKSEAFNIRVVK